MEYVQLGSTDLKVSRIAFGTWQLSSKMWGAISRENWCTALRKAADLGVNLIDTAEAYGDGYAESCVGDLIASEKIRDRFVIASKFHFNQDGQEQYPDSSYRNILRACEASLRRLRTDCIDLYQVHHWNSLAHPEEVAAAFGRLKEEGKIRWAGVCNMNVDQIHVFQRHWAIATLQSSYSLLVRDIERHELPLCLEDRIGFLAYSPLYRGLLTGKYPRDHVFAEGRANLPLFGGSKFDRVLQALEAVKPIAQRLGLTLPMVAVRWVLTHPAVSSAIVGIKTSEQIESIAPAAGNPLPARDWHRIAEIMAQAQKEAEALPA